MGAVIAAGLASGDRRATTCSHRLIEVGARGISRDPLALVPGTLCPIAAPAVARFAGRSRRCVPARRFADLQVPLDGERSPTSIPASCCSSAPGARDCAAPGRPGSPPLRFRSISLRSSSTAGAAATAGSGACCRSRPRPTSATSRWSRWTWGRDSRRRPSGAAGTGPPLLQGARRGGGNSHGGAHPGAARPVAGGGGPAAAHSTSGPRSSGTLPSGWSACGSTRSRATVPRATRSPGRPRALDRPGVRSKLSVYESL